MRKWIPGVLVLGAYLFSVAVYSQLPERVPTHWGTDGPDGWSSRAVGAFLLPTIALVTWLLLRWLPSIDPRRENYDKFRGTYDAVMLGIVALLVATHVVALGAALGWPIRVERLVPIGVGLLLVVIGNLLPRARPNWFFGIRTPWTLSSERVWERTHRVSGYLMIGFGLVVALTALISSSWMGAIIVPASIVLVLGTYGYSYFAWRSEQRRG
jgi:uncharacterized membrane protein